MSNIPLSHAMMLAGLLFIIGLTGVLIRRDLVFVFMSIEIMLTSANVALIAAAAKHGMVDGHIAVIFVLVTAASEVAVGLALLLRMHRVWKTVDMDQISEMKG